MLVSRRASHVQLSHPSATVRQVKPRTKTHPLPLAIDEHRKIAIEQSSGGSTARTSDPKARQQFNPPKASQQNAGGVVLASFNCPRTQTTSQITK